MPPLTTANAGALVGGGVLGPKEKPMSTGSAPPQTQRGKVLRAFYYQGKVLAKDSTQELPRLFALEMQAAKKFEFVTEPEAPVAPAAPAVEASKTAARKTGRKETSDAE